MSSRINTETSFESYAEGALLARGWKPLAPDDGWDAAHALFPEQACAYIAETQPKTWARLQATNGDALRAKVAHALADALELSGALEVLRQGFKVDGKRLRVAMFRPAHGLNASVLRRYRANRLHVVRQLRCHGDDTVDLTLVVGGIPVATCELKNPGTGQTWHHAVQQYRQDRRPDAPLFRFKTRTLVHFAVDPNEAYMTTRLRGEATYFLPFNRGSAPEQPGCGAGNPEHPSGYRTGYLFEEVMERDNWLELLGRFLFVEREHTKPGQPPKETLIFPRYHQREAVRRLVASAASEGAGHNYLIQHSAGSGKTKTIAWLAHRLSTLHAPGVEGGTGGAHTGPKVFDAVVVVTDRTVLDAQLQDAIYQIDHTRGVVQAVDRDASQLAEALVNGVQIVVTTIQKFPFVLRGLLRRAGADRPEDATDAERAQAKAWASGLSEGRYAVVIDEAHSGQSGEAARTLKGLLGRAEVDIEDEWAEESEGSEGSFATSADGRDSDADDDEADFAEQLSRVVASRGRQPNLSFFAFTATPKGKTLEVFGRPSLAPGADGKPQPFHLYAMRQAIEEGFILDVLQHYTTYKTYYRLEKAAADDPDLPKRKTTRALAKFTSLHPHNIAQKTEIIVEHFREHVRPKLGGRAKAMVVTQSRLHAVRYRLAFDAYIRQRGYTDVRPVIAISGVVLDRDTGAEYSEPSMNTHAVTGKPVGVAQLKDYFATDHANVMVAANKYQTGFDQPLLLAMYVDKRLDGVQAVQTLSRLNRMLPGKPAPFVLDFRNEADDIYRAFKPYYEQTSLQEESDPALLAKLRRELEEAGVFDWSEVDAFARVFYKPEAKQRASDQAELLRLQEPARRRYAALAEDEDRAAFRDRLSAYERAYAFLSQIIPYGDAELEQLYAFARTLIPYLPTVGEDEPVVLGDQVEMRYYRMDLAFAGAIRVEEGEAEGVRSPSAVGTGGVEDPSAPLSNIITTINDRFGTDLGEEDRLFIESVKVRAQLDERFIQTARANTREKFKLGVRQLLQDLMLERVQGNDAIAERFVGDRAFNRTLFGPLADAIYDAIHSEE